MSFLARKTLASITAPFSKSLANPAFVASKNISTNNALHCYRKAPGQSDNMMDIGCRPLFNTDHDMLRSSCRKFFTEEVMPHHLKWCKEGSIPREVWAKAGALGFLGTDTPEEHGGLGGTFKDAAIVMEEQSYTNCSGPGFALHSQIVMPYITHYGTKDQIDHFIPAMVSGEKIGAIAMTEPGAGSDLQGVQTNAKPDGDDWILNGSKTYITNGYMADVVIVVAVTNPEAKSKAHGISLFLVEEGMKGFTKGKPLQKMGMKAQDTCELFFEDVRLPASALLGKPNHGFYELMQELPQERLLIGIMCTANCEWMFETTREYVKQRKAFGRTLAYLQTIQHKLAEIKSQVCMMRAFTDQCIELHTDAKLDGAFASMNKYLMSEMQNKIAGECVQLHGGAGYMDEYPICHAYIDAKVQSIYGGANEIMKELIGRTCVA